MGSAQVFDMPLHGPARQPASRQAGRLPPPGRQRDGPDSPGGRRGSGRTRAWSRPAGAGCTGRRGSPQTGASAWDWGLRERSIHIQDSKQVSRAARVGRAFPRLPPARETAQGTSISRAQSAGGCPPTHPPFFPSPPPVACTPLTILPELETPGVGGALGVHHPHVHILAGGTVRQVELGCRCRRREWGLGGRGRLDGGGWVCTWQ